MDTNAALLDDASLDDLNNMSTGSMGATYEAKNVYDNLPARKKFLNSASTEFQHIKNVVVNLALGFPNIQFQLFHNTKKILSTSGNGRILDSVS